MDPLKMYFLLKMGIFHGYVSLPEGTVPTFTIKISQMWVNILYTWIFWGKTLGWGWNTWVWWSGEMCGCFLRLGFLFKPPKVCNNEKHPEIRWKEYMYGRFSTWDPVKISVGNRLIFFFGASTFKGLTKHQNTRRIRGFGWWVRTHWHQVAGHYVTWLLKMLLKETYPNPQAVMLANLWVFCVVYRFSKCLLEKIQQRKTKPSQKRAVMKKQPRVISLI